MNQQIPSDIVLKNGHILTMDAKERVVQAVAVGGERIVAVGTEEEILPFIGQETKVIDLKQAIVLPGLIDTHAHFPRIGRLVAERALLYDCTSIEEVIARLIEHKERLPDSMPILGHGDCFFETHFAERCQICATDLDRVANDRPVAISDVNKTIINSYALDHCVTWDAAPADPRLSRDERAEKSVGVFYFGEKAMVKVESSPVEMSPEEAICASAAQFAAYGVTTVADPGPPLEFIRAYYTMGQAGKLSTRLVIMPSTNLVSQVQFQEEFPHCYGTEGHCYRFGPANCIAFHKSSSKVRRLISFLLI